MAKVITGIEVGGLSLAYGMVSAVGGGVAEQRACLTSRSS